MSGDSTSSQASLLSPGDPAPVEVMRPGGHSPMLLLVDHAGRAVPERLGRLGLPEDAFERHIAWDIGIMGVARHLSALLDATAIAQPFSRLVIDCNRTPGHPTSIAPVSDGTIVPGNRDLSDADRAMRVHEIFEPYQHRIEAEIDRRLEEGRPPVVVALHSFTPVMAGVARPWHAGILHNHEPSFGRALLALLEAEGDLVVGDNEPYRLSDESDHTVPRHGERRGLLHAEIEIRQDLIAAPDGQRAWAERLARLLPQARERVGGAAAP